MNQPSYSRLLSRKQMPGREQRNLGKDIRRSKQVKARGQPEGGRNKKNEKQNAEKSQARHSFYWQTLLGAFEGPNMKHFSAGGCKDEDSDEKICKTGEFRSRLEALSWEKRYDSNCKWYKSKEQESKRSSKHNRHQTVLINVQPSCVCKSQQLRGLMFSKAHLLHSNRGLCWR